MSVLQMGVYILIELYKCFEEEGKSTHQIITTKVCNIQILQFQSVFFAL